MAKKYFSDNLAEHLANNEINMKTALIKWPFPTCLFIFTSRIVSILCTIFDYPASISAFLTVHRARDDLPGRNLIICIWHAKLTKSSYLMFQRDYNLVDDGTWEQVLRIDWETLTLYNLDRGRYVNVDDDTTAHQHDDTFSIDGLAVVGIILGKELHKREVLIIQRAHHKISFF